MENKKTALLPVMIMSALATGCVKESLVRNNQDDLINTVEIISECNEPCRQEVENHFGFRFNSLGEHLSLGTHRGVLMYQPMRIVYLDEQEIEWQDLISPWQRIETIPGEHVATVKYVPTYDDFSAGKYVPSVQLEVGLRAGQYAFGSYAGRYGRYHCWAPFIFEYQSGKVVFPERDRIDWFEHPAKRTTNADILKYQLAGIPVAPGQCQNMPDIIKENEGRIETQKPEKEADIVI